MRSWLLTIALLALIPTLAFGRQVEYEPLTADDEAQIAEDEPFIPRAEILLRLQQAQTQNLDDVQTRALLNEINVQYYRANNPAMVPRAQGPDLATAYIDWWFTAFISPNHLDVR